MDVTIEEVTAVMRIVRNVADDWDDPAAWRKLLLQRTCELLNGHVGAIMADYNPEQGWFGSLVLTSVVGLPEPMETMYRSAVARLSQRSFEDVAQDDPGIPMVVEQLRSQGWVTVAANNLSDIAASICWPMYEEVLSKIDCEHNVNSIRIVDVPQRPEAISIHRPQGAAPFGARDVALMKLLHDELAPLIGVRLTTEEHFSRDGLSKRLRETLSLLLEGQSEKQVATSLNLSSRTVHDYVTRLYEHFHVSSRAELLAYFISRTPMPRASTRITEALGDT
jgi:DNA-binding CsgD family transcriptional regulator